MAGDAIIFIPGIRGTKLVNTNRVNFDTIWSGIQSNFETIEDLELTHRLENNYYDENINTIIQAGEIEELAYAEFIHDLNPKKPVYIFNYDWRFSAVENAEKLADFINYLISKSEASRETKTYQSFDFITHSLGNYILLAYMNLYEFTNINKIVFAVPPFKGSINIASVVVMGEGLFRNVKSRIRKLIRTMPGALELLPNYEYASEYADSNIKHNFFNFDHWQSNITNPKDKDKLQQKNKKMTAEKFKDALKVAKDTAFKGILDLNDLEIKDRRKCIVIARTGYKTWQSVKIYKEAHAPNPKNYIDFDNGLQNDCGDGRVADSSSCYYHDAIKTLLIKDAFKYRDYKHAFFLKDERVQRIVNRFLGGEKGKYWEIPGDSVKRVRNLETKKDRDTQLQYKEAKY